MALADGVAWTYNGDDDEQDHVNVNFDSKTDTVTKSKHPSSSTSSFLWNIPNKVFNLVAD